MTTMKLLPDLAKLLLLGLLLAGAFGGCASARSRPPTAALSPDSLALLKEAIEQVRPAYATQEEALQSGAYGSRRSAGNRAPEPLGVASGMRGDSDLEGNSADGQWVIQIAAFENRSEASEAALLAERFFPYAAVIIERAGPYFRVALVGWYSRTDASRNLRSVRRSYPGAWVRARVLP